MAAGDGEAHGEGVAATISAGGKARAIVTAASNRTIMPYERDKLSTGCNPEKDRDERTPQ
jgi:hypothetical protein